VKEKTRRRLGAVRPLSFRLPRTAPKDIWYGCKSSYLVRSLSLNWICRGGWLVISRGVCRVGVAGTTTGRSYKSRIYRLSPTGMHYAPGRRGITQQTLLFCLKRAANKRTDAFLPTVSLSLKKKTVKRIIFYQMHLSRCRNVAFLSSRLRNDNFFADSENKASFLSTQWWGCDCKFALTLGIDAIVAPHVDYYSA